MKLEKRKGAYGYYQYQRIRELALAILYISLVVAIFATGYATTKTRMNLLTVVAVLGCLPSCKQIVVCIMVFRKKPCSPERQKRIDEQAEHVLTSYELLITSQKRAYAFDAACVKGGEVLLLAHEKGIRTQECQEFLKEILKNNEKPNCNIRIYEDEKRFLEHLSRLAAKDADDAEKSGDIMRVLLAISV